MRFAGPNPFPQAVIDRDLISGIVRRYLEPTFQCEVQVIRSAAGHEHPIVVVPPHGAVPICSKAGGPEVNGKPRGIAQGVYYGRRTGPESAPLLTPSDWNPIIRRCVAHERTSILSAIDAAIRGPGGAAPITADALKAWHDAAHAVFLADVAARPEFSDLASAHWQLSYAIEQEGGQQLDPSQLVTILRQVNAEVNDFVRTGWSMFYVFDVPEIRPFFRTDPASGEGEGDFLECAIIRDTRANQSIRLPDMWRVAPNGKATLVRNYWEDLADTNHHFKLNPGTWFSPNMLVRSLAEFIRHARGLAERFDVPTTVSFRIEWHGLNGRRVHDPWGLWWNAWISRANERVSTGSWPVTMLSDAWPEIVAELAAPAMRLFTTDFVISPEWVRGQAPNWLR